MIRIKMMMGWWQWWRRANYNHRLNGAITPEEQLWKRLEPLSIKSSFTGFAFLHRLRWKVQMSLYIIICHSSLCSTQDHINSMTTSGFFSQLVREPNLYLTFKTGKLSHLLRRFATQQVFHKILLTRCEETKGGSQRRLASVGVSRMLSRAGTLPTPTLHFTPPILIIRFSYTQNAHTYHIDHIHNNQLPTYHTFLKHICIKTKYQSLYSQTNILILSTVLEELR